jgi:hypothetical protein
VSRAVPAVAESRPPIYRAAHMVEHNEDLERLLTELHRRFELAGDSGVYLVGLGPGQSPCALSISPPVLLAQVQVGPLPVLSERASVTYLRRLLELNSSGLLHAAFALDKDKIILTAALELQNLNSNELAAVLSDLEQALSEHVPDLVALSQSLGG